VIQNNQVDLSRFFLAGISYKKADAETRGSFAISHGQYRRILEQVGSGRVDGLFVISTCNRTEIYGITQNEDQLIRLLCDQTRGNEKTFRKLAYIKNGMEAVMPFVPCGCWA